MRIVTGLIGLLLAVQGVAQVSGQVSIATDNVLRGVSINDGRPGAAAEINYDASAGWFVGGQISETHLYGEEHVNPEWVVDAGYAHTMTSGLAWEVGATYAVFPSYTFWNYRETFVGLLSEHWNARLSYSPDYFGRRQRTLYAECNYVRPLGERVRLLGHVGMLHGDSRAGAGSNRTLDASVGIGVKLSGANIQLNWITTNRTSLSYPVAESADRRRWVLSAAYGF